MSRLWGNANHGAGGLPRVWRGASESPVGLPDAEPEPLARDRTTQASRVARVEAVLFFADGPIHPRRMARAAGLEGPGEARRLVEALRERLARRHSALEVVMVAGGWRMVTQPRLAAWIDRLSDQEDPQRAEGLRLSRPAGETLAIVAYRQPVVRAEIEAIRGVSCGEVLRQLLDAELLRIVGRSEGLGRPLLYGTTPRFLEHHGLESLDRLPGRVEGTRGVGPTTGNAIPGAA